ncbi:MAG TPA: GNAT family N-acetyltransferase [Phototrophicaceae bacterium]|nr:GNAT family N-acetyltransferase [Phototrophicaceae bacterium]
MAEIRAAVVADAVGIARVHVLTWQHAYRGQMPDRFLDSLSMEQRTQTWKANLSNPRPKARTLAAVEGDQIVGFCGIGASREADAGESSGELYAIYVDSAFMRQGIGAALMNEALRLLREDGFMHATLWVLTSNTQARGFYEHFGWAADGASKTEARDDFELHELRYAITL